MISVDEALEYEGKDVVVTMAGGEEFAGRLTEVVFDVDPDEYGEECLSLHIPGCYVELNLSEVEGIRQTR